MSSIEQILQPIQTEFQLFEQEFERTLQTDNPLLKEALSWVSARRGKQLRPMVVLLTAKLSGEINEKTITTAVALELLHTASLIHDDVVDASDLRRGMPTLHKQFNNKVAILVGDYLLSKVIEIVASLRNIRILSIVADMGKALASGELLQLGQKANPTRLADIISEDDYFRIISQKTARLFSACAEAGAVSAGATSRTEKALTTFGEQLGICFQMQDDILDYSDSEELGKPTMADIRDGKITLPLLISLKRAPKEEQQHILSLVSGSIDSMDEQDIRSFVMRYDGIRYTQKKMQEHRRLAGEALLGAVKAQRDTRTDKLLQSLTLLADYSVNRIS